MRGKPLENQAQWREHRLIIIASTSHGLVDGMTEIGLFREDGGTSVVIAERLQYTASYGILRLFVKSFFTAPMVAHGHLTHPCFTLFQSF